MPGALDTGRPRVLLAHGWGGWGLQWSAWVEPLLAAGHEIVTFDQPGHGRSSGWFAHGVSFAQTLRRVSDSLGPFDAVIGHSFGAAMLTTTLGDGLADLLANGPGARIARPRPRVAVLIAPPVDLVDATHQFARTIGLSEAARTRMRHMLEQRIGVDMDSFSIRHNGPRADVPALLVHDESDREVPFACTEAVRRHWRGPLRVLPTRGLGHRRILSDPGVIEAGIDFLRRTLGGV